MCNLTDHPPTFRLPGPRSQPGLPDSGSSAVEGGAASSCEGGDVARGTTHRRPGPSPHCRPGCPAGRGSFHPVTCPLQSSPSPSPRTSARRGSASPGPASLQLWAQPRGSSGICPGLSPQSPRPTRLFLNRCEGCTSEAPASSLAPEREAPGGPAAAAAAASPPWAAPAAFLWPPPAPLR